ncbi:MAG: autotransporter outer membrane beta-barrel domain-containing protein [Rhodospirillales bacterium]|nr:autotransporter outer membrane beta-barrel domain-containing protein [Rhodospirillales bacterium]MCB9996769.1 autotransporter outer membrane beta-barrel domain-containing protein [Rhodospirillales bacterium]
MFRKPAAVLAALFTIGMVCSIPQRAQAEDCTGVLPSADCVLDEDTTAPLQIDQNTTLTIDAVAAGGTLTIGDEIDGFFFLPSVRQGDIETAGGGGTIIQEADIGRSSILRGLTINAGDMWFVSGGSDIFLNSFSSIFIDSGSFVVTGDSADSIINANIIGGGGADILDFVSGGQSFGITGNIGLAGNVIELGAGDDRFIYYQSAGSMIGADYIFMGTGANLMGVMGSGEIFAGDFYGGANTDTLAFLSGSDAIFGSSSSLINLGVGDDIIDFDSGNGTAGGTINAGTVLLGGGADLVAIGDNAALQIFGTFDAGDDADTVVFTSGGYINAMGAVFSMGDGDDLIDFNEIAFVSGVTLASSRGMNVSGGGILGMGAGDDTILFHSGVVGLDATGGTVQMGTGDDHVLFQHFTPFSGAITFASGMGLISTLDGGTGTDILEFGSANINAYGSGPHIFYGSADGAAAITNVETIDIGNGFLQFVGTIDAAGNVVNFASAEFWGPGTDIAGTIWGTDSAVNLDTLSFISGAALSGIAYLSAGNDTVIFNSGNLTGSIEMGADDDSFSAGGGSTISGIIDGGGQAGDTATFIDGLTTITGTVTGFSSATLNATSTVNVRGAGLIDMPIMGTGTLQFGSAGSSAFTFTPVAAIDGVNIEVLGDTLDTNGISYGGTTSLRGLAVNSGAMMWIRGGDTVDMQDGVVDADGFLDIAGTLRLENTATVLADNYVAANPGTFVFEVNSDGTNTTMAGFDFAEGGIDFSADTFQFLVAPGSGNLITDVVVFASAGGAITGPGTLIGDSILYDLTVSNPSANELQLEIQQLTTVAALTNSQSNEDMANVLLVDLLNSTDTGINAVQNALLGAADADEFNQVLEAARPIVNGSDFEGIQNVSRQTFGLINQRLAMLRNDKEGKSGISTGDLTDELEAWWQFYGQTADQERRGTVSGYEMTTYGLAVGVDRALFDYGVFGVGFSWGETTSNSKGYGDAETEVDSYMLSLYGDYDFGHLYMNGMLSYGYNDIYTAKTSAAGTRTASYHANNYTARAEMGYAFMPGKTRLIPKVMGQYSYYSPESYTEEGPAGQIITRDSIKAFEVGAGLDMQWLIGNRGESYWVPELRLGYRHDLAGEAVVSTTRFVEGGSVFEVQGSDPATEAYDLGMGLTYFSQDAWELLFNYDFTYKQDYMSHAGMVRAAYKFYP